MDEGRSEIRILPTTAYCFWGRYNSTQIFSVILVTLGVVCTMLSASQPGSIASSWTSPEPYYMGILTLALLMSGFMGLAQDTAYAKYGRGHWQVLFAFSRASWVCIRLAGSYPSNPTSERKCKGRNRSCNAVHASSHARSANSTDFVPVVLFTPDTECGDTAGLCTWRISNPKAHRLSHYQHQCHGQRVDP